MRKILYAKFALKEILHYLADYDFNNVTIVEMLPSIMTQSPKNTVSRMELLIGDRGIKVKEVTPVTAYL